MQFSDSFFPSGLFTLSHGLESFVQAGLSAKDVEPLLIDYLEHVVGPSDGLAVAHAHRHAAAGALGGVIEVDRRLYAVKLTREGREASCRVGRKLVGTASAIRGNAFLASYANLVKTGESPGTAAVALAIAAQACGIGEHAAMLLELYTFSTSFLGAALRLTRFDHLESQRILARLEPTFQRVIAANHACPLEDMRAFAPMIDVMAMTHETAEVRLFVN
jgi:urease accessory protein